LQEDVACVQAGIQAHRGVAGDGFAVGDCPLNGSGAAVFGKKGGVQVDVAQAREVEHPLGDDAAVADYDDGIGVNARQL
jgi:hypothetical protein